MARRPTPGVIHGPLPNMTGAPQGPSKTIPALPGSVTPQPAVAGSGVNDEPKMRPVEGPNKKFAEGFYDK